MSSPRKSSSYWTGQIVACAIFGVLASSFGVLLMNLHPDAPGKGVLFLSIGVAFFAALIWLVRQYRGMSKEQRAIYAWAITQQRVTAPRANPVADGAMMATAAKARDGLLSRTDIQQLQALEPGNPYPAPLPAAPAA